VSAERRGEQVVCTDRGPAQAVQFSTVPADAEPVEPRMTISGVQHYDSAGQIYFVTVREPEISMLDWFVLRKNPASELHTYKELYGDSTPDEQTQQGYQMMRDAKETAEYVAFSRAGIPGTDLADGPAVIADLCLQPGQGRDCALQGPAAGVLKPGDRITAVDGTPVNVLGDLTPIMKTHQPGDVIEVTVQRSGEADQTVKVTTIASPDEPGRTLVGFIPADTRQIRLPKDITVDINTNHIGGPSAGTAFALSLLDALTPGSLMGHGDVAVTGTIDVDGNVGAIGGLSSKASAVEQVGVKYFIVPEAQGPADIAHAQQVVGDSVKLIPVKTFDEALQALASLGGDPLPEPPSPPTT
jgi:PDZ domain-containing protein